MSELGFDESNGSGLGYGQLLSVLVRRRVILIGVLLSCLVIATLSSLRKDETYRSSMQLLVEPNYNQNPQVLRGGPGDGRNNEPVFSDIDYATQVRLMQSPILVERAVTVLLPEYPEISIDEIRSGLAVSRVVETEDEIDTKILQVDYTSENPNKARRVLEVMQDVYSNYNLEQQQIRLQNGLAFIDEQLPEVRADLANAERALRQFREQQIVVNPEQQAAEIVQALNAIANQRRVTQAEFRDTQARFNNIQQQLDRSPSNALLASRLSQSQRFQNLLGELQTIQLEIARQRVTYSDNAPPLRSLLTQLDKQRDLLQQEAERVLGDAAQVQSSDDNLMEMAQLGQTDLNLVGQLVDTQSALVGLSSRDQSLAESEARLKQQLNQFPQLISEYNRLQPDITTKQETLQQLLTARQELGVEIAQGGYNWQIVEEPEDGYQTGPNVKTDIMMGGIAGLFLGIVLAFVTEGLDNKIRTAKQLRELGRVPQLGSLPWFEPSKTFKQTIVGNIPLSSHFFSNDSSAMYGDSYMFQVLQWLPFREALDLLYKNIQLFNPNRVSTSLAITSSLANEGKSTTALGLAITAARLHQRVLLIDADLRDPTLHRTLGVSGDAGLTSILENPSENASVYAVSLVDCTFDFLPAGDISSDPVRLLSSQAMHDILRGFEQQYDLVILDSSPVLGVVDALQTASVSRSTLLVSRIGLVSQSEVTDAIALLERFNLVGLVANGDRSANFSSYPYTQLPNRSIPYEPTTTLSKTKILPKTNT